MGLQSENVIDLAATPAMASHGMTAVAPCPEIRAERDACAVRNERVKLFCGFLNALGLTLIGFALLKPVTQDISALTAMSFVWVGIGGALHGGAQLMLGRLIKPGE